MVKQLLRNLAPVFALRWYHRLLAFLGALIYGFPSRKLIVIGVTGTKGKTSVVHLAAKVLEGAGYKVGVISSLAFKVGSREEQNRLKMTMPGRFFIQKKLSQMVDAGCSHAVLEITSEGIAQFRHTCIDFDTLVFTNIAPEHIEAHGSFEKYLAEKQKLFAALASTRRDKIVRGKRVKPAKTIIVNGDDAHADDFISFWAERKYCCHVQFHKNDEELTPRTHIVAENVVTQSTSTTFSVHDTPFTLRLSGTFNVTNTLLALAVGMAEGISLSTISESIAKVDVLPGRMEFINAGQPFTVVVDYAHTPDSLDAVYRALCSRQDVNGHKEGRLICVLGAAGGGRDRWKRPVLGAIAGVWCDVVMVTNEDPYDEDPRKIMEEVAGGVKRAHDVYQKYFDGEFLEKRAGGLNGIPHLIYDRREAIRKALTSAHSGDVVVITGKGAEQMMAVEGGKKVPWDDRQVIREEIARLL